MKYFAALTLISLVSGCAGPVAQEDKDFFWGGWVNPEKGSRQRTGEEDRPGRSKLDIINIPQVDR